MRSTGIPALFLVLSVVFLALVVGIFVEDTTPAWKMYQEAYREHLVAGARTPKEEAAARRFPIEIRQIVVPGTGAVDRCTTCHIAADDPAFSDEPHPLRYHPEHDRHPFDKFGCTVCHGGQARAVDKDQAHGRVEHWERPLIPMPFIEASCGKCHFPRGLESAPTLLHGRALFEERGCRGCHKLNGAGGVIGPDLTGVGRAGGRSPEWLMDHFRDPQSVVPGSAMPQYAFTDAEIAALTMYMLSRTDEQLGSYFLSQRFVPTPEVGEKLFEEKGCIGCHSVKGYGGDVGPPLDNVSERRSAEWLYRHFQVPRDVTPATVMPDFDFTDAEAKALTLFVVSLTDQSEYRPTDIPALQSPIERGKALYKRYGCIGCHGPNGEGGVANPNAATANQVPGLRYVAEGYTEAELEKQIKKGQQDVARENPDGPRPPLYMPPWENVLTERQIDDLRAYLFSLLPQDAGEEW